LYVNDIISTLAYKLVTTIAVCGLAIARKRGNNQAKT